MGLAVFLAWRMVVVNLSELSLKKKGEDAAVKALEWAPGNPLATLQRVFETADADPGQAEKMLVGAIRERPSDGRMLATLGLLFEQRQALEKATRAMQYADTLAPDRVVVQLEVAAYWARRGDLERYLRHLIHILNLRYDYGDRLHPVLLKLVDNPSAATEVRRVLSTSLANDGVSWWRRFFVYAVAPHAQHLDTVRMLYQIRSQAGLPREDNRERVVFQNRLEKEGEWTEAYFTWLNALDKEHLAQLGNLFNGGFELPLSNEGFGWRAWNRKGVEADTAVTSGVSGHKALRVSYNKYTNSRDGVGQTLMLSPGRYELTGRVRTDGLRTESGVRWEVQCGLGGWQRLGETVGFNGTRSWHGFSASFEVPEEGCRVQRMHLRVVDRSAEVAGISGVLWFDDLVIRNLETMRKPSTLTP